MNEIKFRTLKVNEIEVRPSHIQNGKANMLLYIDSRAVVKLLNESIGNMNWQSEFYSVNGQTMCRIGIYDFDKSMWVWKSDTGSESNIEAEKGLISDCYKRVLARWGVTELYTAPNIIIPDDGYKNTGYKVVEIDYTDDREIKHLVISNRFGKEVFRWDIDNTTQATPAPIYSTPSITTPSNEIDDVLAWTPENNNPTPITLTKQLTPAEELTQWYQSVTHNDIVDKFYGYWYNRLSTNGWKGKFNLNDLISKYCK